MSGGSLDYFSCQLEDHVGDFGDKELDELVKDLAALFHLPPNQRFCATARCRSFTARIWSSAISFSWKRATPFPPMPESLKTQA